MERGENDRNRVQTGHAPAWAAVIGDVVASRAVEDGWFEPLQQALRRANRRVEAVQPLQITVGDEFQGLYRELGDALNATLLVHLLLHGTAHVRFGIGWGGLTRSEPEHLPYQQDGPAWWAARDAIEAAGDQERKVGMPAGWRTVVRPAALRSGPSHGGAGGEAEASSADPREELSAGNHVDGLTDAVVMFRDHLVSRLDDRDVRLVLALLDGTTVTDAADQVGISQQAASRRLRTNGGYALVRSWSQLGGKR